ncbi:ABC transporter substrate-binding protein [Actinacidiphila sp. ITFR-21]|uniref:ABC transporter substrate-binding protein n=1 Tax=Actinacidiphila sp. ITFR-21 TaxID=3075199 RepID=UPI0028894A53|nr:ABC transporter substrate-binding protein [Streptomyces sp. ITFR-21]WNI16464.1 ABC transporter substrate-binding protein [Streptomyces sp. ITFR-21]
MSKEEGRAPRGAAGGSPSGRHRRSRRVTAALAVASAVALTAAACGSGGSGGGGKAADGTALTSLKVGIPSPAVTVFSATYAIGQYTGCYKRYGYKFSTEVTTNPSQLVAAMHRGAVDVGVPGSDQYLNMLKTVGSDGSLPLSAFYQLYYPFKYGMAVKPDSDITSLKQLEGRTVGVDVLSDSSSTALKALLKAQGVDPGKVKIIATGTGAASGQALDSGKVAGLFYYDVGFGTILQAGIKLRFLTTDDGKPPYLNVSGIMAVANSADMAKDKAKYRAFARCTTEGDIFVETNPAAAAYIMLTMYPTLGKPGESLEKQIEALTLPLLLRQKLIKNPNPGGTYGQINPDEFTEDLKILLDRDPGSVDVDKIYSNADVPQLTDAEIAAVKQQAADFKIPGVSGTVKLPTVPPNAP